VRELLMPYPLACFHRVEEEVLGQGSGVDSALEVGRVESCEVREAQLEPE